MGTYVKALGSVGLPGTFLDASIAAARGGGATRVVVVGGEAVRAHCGASVDDVIAESPVGRENIERAMTAAGAESLLLMSSDIPFVDAAAVAGFLQGCGNTEIAFPIADPRDYLRAFPGSPPHVTRIGREYVVGGSVVYFAPGVAPRALAIAQQLFDARKNPVHMATILGPALLLHYALGRLTIAAVERRAYAVLGVAARAVRGASPALCFDVDTLEDYLFACEHVRRGG
jgi:CTP:molybdopterin cytidylyltransferase MocA